MKLRHVILIIFVLFSFNPECEFVRMRQSFNIQITGDAITIISVFPWGAVPNTEELKKGVNEGYYALNDSQSFEYKIINY